MATGTVRKRGKHWQIDISLGYIEGKQKRKRWTSKALTKAEAINEMNDELYKLNRVARTGGAIDNSYLLANLYEDWCKYLDLKALAKSTLRLYRTYCLDMITELNSLGITKVGDITAKAINEVALEMINHQSHNTTNKCIKYLKSMLNWGVESEIILSNPIAKIKLLPNKRVKLRRALTADEAKALIKEAPPSYSLIWRFFLSTGLRRNELTTLTWNNIDLEAKTVRVVKSKTEAGKRTIPLSPELVKELLKTKNKKGLVFKTQNDGIRTNNLIRELRRHMKRVLLTNQGIPCGTKMSRTTIKNNKEAINEIELDLQKIDIHALRYTFCTHLIGTGVDIKTVQSLMGHSSPEVTLRVYAQYCHGNAESAIDKLPW